MDNFRALKREVHLYSMLIIVLALLLVLSAALIASEYLQLDPVVQYAVLIAAAFVTATIASVAVSTIALGPSKAIIQAVNHVRGNASLEPAPQIDTAKIGKAFIKDIALFMYDTAGSAPTSTQVAQSVTGAGLQVILDHLPLPLIALDGQQQVTAMNALAKQYLGLDPTDTATKHLYDVANLSFPSEFTFELWHKDCLENKLVDTHFWQRVRINDTDGNPVKQFDLAASYIKLNESTVTTLLQIVDRTKQYAEDDRGIGFVAMAVHELRTPITMLRGYIEVFEQELGPNLQGEMLEYMHKLSVAAQQLTSFTSNILNVARVEESGLYLKLVETNWTEALTQAISDLQLRAAVNGKTLDLHIAEGLPTVAADRLSIVEVVTNLVDNAIKYSGTSTTIAIRALRNSEGLIETSVQDYGIGIPTNIVGNVFEKFYRSHKSRSSIGGTGLGLYLSKAIVGAHGGHIWFRTKENEGTIFSFTLLPYSMLAESERTQGNDDIIRGAHGWIKNHSLYRR